jgi:four helix bundle protein
MASDITKVIKRRIFLTRKFKRMKKALSDRFLNFSVVIIKLGKLLKRSFEGRHVYGQLFRSGTSAGANYEESHSAQSRKDFIHKREISLKELRESLYWLKIIQSGKLMDIPSEDLAFLLNENEELIRIVAKSVATMKDKMNIN